MTEKTIKFRDPVVERVVDKFVSRSDIGFEKYGKTLHDERTGGHKDLAGYLNDVQEELMDAILYIQAAKEDLKDQVEFVDAIGDMVVVLTNMAMLGGTSIETCIDTAYDEIKSRKGKMVNGTFVKNG